MSLSDLKPGQLKILKAVAVLLEDPSAKITIARISKQVQVTEAAIYRHYRSKDEIFEALMSYMEANLLSPLNQAQSQPGATSIRLRMVFDVYMDFLSSHPGLARLFLGHGANEASSLTERIKMLNAKIRSQLAQMLRYGQAEENPSVDDMLTPEQAAEMFYGLIVSSAMAQVFEFPQIDQESRWNLFSQSVLNEQLAITSK